MRNYNIFYNQITDEVKVVFDELGKPEGDFKRVGLIEHDIANQSAQQLRTKVITYMAEKFPANDIGLHTKIKFHDEEPYGHEVTENSERRLNPDKFEDDPEDLEPVDPNVGTSGSSVGNRVTENTEDESVAGEGGEGQTRESLEAEQLKQLPEGTTAEQVGGVSREPESELNPDAGVTGNLTGDGTQLKKSETEEPKAEKLSVSAPETNLQVGQFYMIEAKVNDGAIRDMDLVYESSDATIARVTKAGKVTAVAKGEATIRTGLKANMDIYADTKVTVEEVA